MTLKEAFDLGGCKVGNLVILEGGQHFLIGDATPYMGPNENDGGYGWDGWLGKTVLHIFDLLNPQARAILERYKDLASIPGETAAPEIKGIEDVPYSPA